MGRRNKNIAKVEIYAAFRGFIEAGQTKVTVSSVIEATGMNRKTFYNHFANQDELVAWGFRRDLLDILLESHTVEELDMPPEDLYGFEDLPCYFRNPSNVISLDQSGFFYDWGNVFERHREYYRAILRSEFSAPFCAYLVTMFRGLFIQDIDYFLSGRRMPDEAKWFIATTFAEAVVHYVVDAFLGLTSLHLVADIKPVNNIVHESMLHMVEAYQSQKSQQYFTNRSLL